MSQRRYGAVAGVVGGRLVVAGGYCRDDGGLLTSAEAHTGTAWTRPPTPHIAYYATACVLNGRLYVIGGWNSNELQVLEMTEENGMSWSCKADLPAARNNAASVVYSGRMWVMGGFEGGVTGGPTASVIIYDARRRLGSPSTPRAAAAAQLRQRRCPFPGNSSGAAFPARQQQRRRLPRPPAAAAAPPLPPLPPAAAAAPPIPPLPPWPAAPPIPPLPAAAAAAQGAIALFDSNRMFEYKDAAWSVVAEGDFNPTAACGSVLLG